MTFPYKKAKHLLELTGLIRIPKPFSEKTLKQIAKNLLVCSNYTQKQVLLYMPEVEKAKIKLYMESYLSQDTNKR